MSDFYLSQIIRLRSEVRPDGTLIRTLRDAMDYVQQHRSHSSPQPRSDFLQRWASHLTDAESLRLAEDFHVWCRAQKLILEEFAQESDGLHRVLQFKAANDNSTN